MTEFQQYFDLISIPLAICILGILFIVSGIRTIRTKKAIVVGINSRFRWRKPANLTGNDATKEGRNKIIFGTILLEPVCKIRKQENRSNCDHGREIAGAFFIARGNPTELL
jgi:hypothetical protein